MLDKYTIVQRAPGSPSNASSIFLLHSNAPPRHNPIIILLNIPQPAQDARRSLSHHVAPSLGFHNSGLVPPVLMPCYTARGGVISPHEQFHVPMATSLWESSVTRSGGSGGRLRGHVNHRGRPVYRVHREGTGTRV